MCCRWESPRLPAKVCSSAEIVRLADAQPRVVLEPEQPLVRDREAQLCRQRRVVIDLRWRRHSRSVTPFGGAPERARLPLSDPTFGGRGRC